MFAPVPAPPHYTVFDLGTLGGANVLGAGLNNRSEVVGRLGQNINDSQAFLWTKGKIIKIGPRGGGTTIASQINDSGQVAGTIDPRNDISGKNAYAFLWQKGHLTRLDTPNVKTSYAEGINGKGDIVGRAKFGLHQETGFLWQHGKMLELLPPSGNGTNPRAINDRGQIAGFCNIGAVVWMHEPGTAERIASGDARAINNKGQVVGMSDGTAFLWQNGRLTGLGTLGKDFNNIDYSVAFGINDKGQIVGNSSANSEPGTREYTPPCVFMAKRGNVRFE